MAISALIIEINKEIILNCVLCIHYLIQFKKDQIKTQTLINFDNKINTINYFSIIKLGLYLNFLSFGIVLLQLIKT